jgi:hypothetical protein
MWDAIVAEAVIKPSLRWRTVSISCWVCGLVGDGDEADEEDKLEDGEPGRGTEAERARRGMQRTREAG